MTLGAARTVVALSGGVGGAKLALGLSRVLDPDRLTIVANTGDDLIHLGLHVSPDIDTLMYTLASVENPDTGWGRRDETWSFMAALGEIGGERWFNLGDRDLAVHVLRTERLRAGASLTEATREIARALGVRPAVVPMSDDPVRTIVRTRAGDLPFQHYFVRDRCAHEVIGFCYEGASSARPCAAVLEALENPDLGAILVCPSNPFVSVDPILAIPSVMGALRGRRAPLIAVSPIVGGEAIKGPLAKMMVELALPATSVEIARHYVAQSLLDGFVMDRRDASLAREVEGLGVRTLVTETVMRSLEDRVGLATEIIDFARALRSSG